MGKVPALTDGEVVVSENPAICLYLADRYSYGTLAPYIEEPIRGAYLRWMVFSTAVFEPAIYAADPDDPLQPAAGAGARERRFCGASMRRLRRGHGCWAAASPPPT